MTEIQRLVASGKIPVSFDMHDSEVVSLERPPIYFCMAPRVSYLPLVSRAARESFKDCAPTVGEGGVWFEYDNKPLRWNLPLGVLYDYFCTSQKEESRSHNALLPFKVTIRFQSFPRLNVLPCVTESDVERAYFHSMKQALSLRFQSAQRLMEMPNQVQENIWDCVLLGRRFEDISLLTQPRINNNNDVDNSGQVPLRVVSRQGQFLTVFQSNVPFNSTLSLSHAVGMVLKREEVCSKHWIQGIDVSPQAPVVQVWEEMCAQDLFLYVVVEMES